jgi:hypothetical protein
MSAASLGGGGGGAGGAGSRSGGEIPSSASLIFSFSHGQRLLTTDRTADTFVDSFCWPSTVPRASITIRSSVSGGVREASWRGEGRGKGDDRKLVR